LTGELDIFDGIERFGDASALLLEGTRRVSYRDLAGAADRLGECLTDRHLAFHFAENSEEAVVGYLAFLRARVPVALLSAAMNPALAARLLDIYRPTYVWLPLAMADLVPSAKQVRSLGRYGLFTTAAEPCEIHPDLALLMTTSGSTGSPKFVRQSYRNIAANTRSIAAYLDIGSADRAITSLPMNYVYGLSVINSHLLQGASLVVTDRGLMEKQFWALMKAHEVTSFSGVPYTYQMLKQLRFGRMNLPSLRTLTQAGGKLPVELATEFAGLCRDKGIRFFIMYGAAEATARMSYLPPEHSVEKAGSIGYPIPGGSFTIVDENGNDVNGDGGVGELVYRGANVTMGYATSREDLARGDENAGVLHTGDIARRDADGFYYIVGRKSRFIKIFGNRVGLEDIEHQLRALGIDCACAGRDDKLRIFVVRQEDCATASVAVRDLTGLHHSAFSVTVLDKIPRNEVGKIVYSELPEGD
jgi:acyl-coenzyme A synthetase/AMP-(fatty) acid ligase